MLPIEPLGLSANQWQFLSTADRYVESTLSSERPLSLESTRRQFRTARDILERLNGSYGSPARRGILLADDVGLGKTTVAALVAWIVASAGERRGVRILAPNDVMMRRWTEELYSHVGPLQQLAPALDVRPTRVKARRVGRLSAGSIQVVKHSYAASDFNLACDLLIVDEAHRAKGDATAFSRALRRQKKYARRVLILTATPFSIRLEELKRMLTLIGGESAHPAVSAFKRSLDGLYSGNATRSVEAVATQLATRAIAVAEALGPFVIRHGIDDLPLEQSSFGDRVEWTMEVPPATLPEVELMARIDRALRVARQHAVESAGATNDPRFHVGWRHFDVMTRLLRKESPRLPEPAKAVVRGQIKEVERLRKRVGTHSKMDAVTKTVCATIDQGEKVLLFCHHHATAQELTANLAATVTNLAVPRTPSLATWKKAWNEILEPSTGTPDEDFSRITFIKWLCADQIRCQILLWLDAAPESHLALADSMRRAQARHHLSRETVAEAAKRLYHVLCHSKSSRAVLKEAGDRPDLLPGANGGSRVLGVCEPSGNPNEESLFLHNQQPDTVIAIFNSPFGPDALVVTDRLSEGIDLHRYCRHLIHYELDPSPIRTVQRNGRLRRVNSWAAITNQPIRYAYPAFSGTRDHRLVQIMKKRVDSFSLLLGGVQDFDVEEVIGSEEAWRNEVISSAKQRVAAATGRLCAKNTHIP